MLHVESEAEDFEERFEDLKENGSADDIKAFLKRARDRRDESWSDYLQHGSEKIKADHDRFARLVKDARLLWIKTA